MKNRYKSTAKDTSPPPERLLLRLPSELREHIQTQAKLHGRTMTAEILQNLEAAYRFNDVQMKMAEDREHIVLGHVRRAIESTLRKMSLTQQGVFDEAAPERLLDFARTLENYLNTLTSYSAVKREIEQLDFIASELLALHLGVTIDRACWKLRMSIGELMFGPAEWVYAQNVRERMALLAANIRGHLKES